MTVRGTSREAYESILGNVGAKQKVVLDCIERHGPMTNLQIGFQLHWPINRVTPRTGELENRGLIEDVGQVVQESGRRATLWGAVRKAEQLSFI